MKKLLMIAVAVMGLMIAVGAEAVAGENGNGDERARATREIAEASQKLNEFKKEIAGLPRIPPIAKQVERAEELLILAKKAFEEKNYRRVFFLYTVGIEGALRCAGRTLRRLKEQGRISEIKEERARATERIAEAEEEINRFRKELREKTPLIRIPKYVRWLFDIRQGVRETERALTEAKQSFEEGRYWKRGGTRWIKKSIQRMRERLERMPYLKIDFVAAEWKPVTSLAPRLHHAVEGIFVEPGGTVQVVDIHPRHLRGQRLWVSQDWGKTWRLEKQIADAWSKKDWLQSEVGPEAAKQLFKRRRSLRLPYWPRETRRWMEKVGFGEGSRGIEFNRCPVYPERLVFSVGGIPGKHHTHYLFISFNNGKRWIRINNPGPVIDRMVAPDEDPQQIRIWSLVIATCKQDQIVLFVGQHGDGINILQKAVIGIDEIKKFF